MVVCWRGHCGGLGHRGGLLEGHWGGLGHRGGLLEGHCGGLLDGRSGGLLEEHGGVVVVYSLDGTLIQSGSASQLTLSSVGSTVDGVLPVYN